MFKKGEKRLIYLGGLAQMAMLTILFVGIGLCASSQPDEDFLNLSVGIAFSNGVVEREEDITVKEFIAALNQEGKWRKGDINQWIYTIKKTDPMTNTTNDMSILFVKEKVGGHAAAIMRRVVANGQEMPELVRVNLFAEILKRIFEAKGILQ